LIERRVSPQQKIRAKNRCKVVSWRLSKPPRSLFFDEELYQQQELLSFFGSIFFFFASSTS
jgi:hypothetical protein